MIKKQSDGRWLVDIQPGGRGKKRYRKTFKSKSAAMAFERQLQAKVIENPFYKLPARDNRRLNDVLSLWFETNGALLVTGKQILQRLLVASNVMGNPVLNDSLAMLFIDYRVKRIETGIKPSTMNKELLSFKSVFSSLSSIGLWVHENPFSSVSVIKHQKPRTGFLTIAQVNLLMDRLALSKSDAFLVALVCLSTGARWREAEHLDVSCLSPGLITFPETKSKKPRSVPVSEQLFKQLHSVLSVRRFTDSYTTFSRILKEVAIELPRGQRTHVLRHTFASHFMMARGNILTLQKVLGHSTLEMTMRYAHLSPEYLQEVLEKNPALTIGCHLVSSVSNRIN